MNQNNMIAWDFCVCKYGLGPEGLDGYQVFLLCMFPGSNPGNCCDVWVDHSCVTSPAYTGERMFSLSLHLMFANEVQRCDSTEPILLVEEGH